MSISYTSPVKMQLSAAMSDVFQKISPVTGHAILFGSRARGDERPDSDWDVLILLDKEKITPRDMDEVSYPIRALGWELNQQINPILYTRADWNKKQFTPFYKNVMQEGVAL